MNSSDFSTSISKLLKDKSIIIVGFGREGESTYKLIRKLFPEKNITICDKNENNSNLIKVKNVDDKVHPITGDDYLNSISDYDLIIKSPGISFKHIDYSNFKEKITSQTDLFFRFFSNQIIGITGTKGKSTTSTLIHDIIKKKYNAHLVGNIGIPFFDNLENVNSETLFVAELSANQLQFIHNAPKYSVLLNIYPEHLDHFVDFDEYKSAKLNILHYQNAEDYCVLNYDELLSNIEKIPSKNKLFVTESNINKQNFASINNNLFVFSFNNQLKHYNFKNIYNPNFVDHFKFSILCAISIANILNIEDDIINEVINNFKGLEHRLEFVGEYEKKTFYNDSISTIPQSTIKAIKTIKNAQTIIIGGYDRGIDYKELLEFIPKSQLQNIILVPDVGKRIMKDLNNLKKQDQTIILINDFENAVIHAINITSQNKACLLSPAAASYNHFKNFEERGMKYKEIINRYFCKKS